MHNDIITIKTANNAWSGMIKFGALRIPFIVYIDVYAEGVSALIDCTELGMKELFADSISLVNNKCYFNLDILNVKYEGILREDTPEIIGTLYHGNSLSFPLVLRKGLHIEMLQRPQEPPRPFSYQEEQVSFENKVDGISLSGTLTFPFEAKNAPAVILIAGSGPVNRDEEVFRHKPFLILSDHLTRQGIAVLRFDKRGIGDSTGTFETATIPDLARDVEAAIEYLKSRQEIDSDRLGLIGHSEGGVIAPMIAARSCDVAFIVMLAGPTQVGENVLINQTKMIATVEGQPEEMVLLASAYQKKILDVIKHENNSAVVQEKLCNLAQEHFSIFSDEQKKLYKGIYDTELSLATLEALALSLNTPWMRNFITYDPSIALKHVNVPVLAINGDCDMQVGSQENLAIIKNMLTCAGNKDFTILELPKINHLLQSCSTGSPSEYMTIEETIAPSILDIITSWLLAKTKKNI